MRFGIARRGMNLSSLFTRAGFAVAAFAAFVGSSAATPSIVIDVASGDTLYQQNATQPWFPASLSKLMTVFVALKAEREGRIAMNTPMMVSARAASMAPSKMGFRPGTLVTLDNALKMLMVKSANDLAVTIAEGVSGSVEAFADEMNASAAAIGMHESHFVNPNGLPDPRQISSARDMAVLGRALYVYFPEHADLFDIGAMKLGNRVIPTHNGMLGRYPGADGMKTGFTCAAGFNLVASATQNGRRLIAVVLGAPSAKTRTMLAASLLDKAFAGNVTRSGSALALAATGGEPPDMHDGVCRHRGKSVASITAEIEDMSAPLPSAFAQARGSEGSAPSTAAEIASLPRPVFDPIPVFVGPVPGWNGSIARANGDTTPVQAYSEDKDATADAPLKPAPDAQSMRKGGHRAASAKHRVAKAKKPEKKAMVSKLAPSDGKDGKTISTVAKPAKSAAHASRAKATAAKTDE